MWVLGTAGLRSEYPTQMSEGGDETKATTSGGNSGGGDLVGWSTIVSNERYDDGLEELAFGAENESGRGA